MYLCEECNVRAATGTYAEKCLCDDCFDDEISNELDRLEAAGHFKNDNAPF